MFATERTGTQYTAVIVEGGKKIAQNYWYYENHPSRVKTQYSKHLIIIIYDILYYIILIPR
jgi:hypothetical protein